MRHWDESAEYVLHGGGGGGGGVDPFGSVKFMAIDTDPGVKRFSWHGCSFPEPKV